MAFYGKSRLIRLLVRGILTCFGRVLEEKRVFWGCQKGPKFGGKNGFWGCFWGFGHHDGLWD